MRTGQRAKRNLKKKMRNKNGGHLQNYAGVFLDMRVMEGKDSDEIQNCT